MAMTWLSAGLAPAWAGPPDGPAGVTSRLEVPWAFFIEDFDTGLVAVSGAPAQQWCLGEGAHPVDVLVVDVPGDPIVVNSAGEVTLWVYAADGIDDLCGTVLGGGTATLVAVADDVRFRYVDNYEGYDPGGRSNAFGLTAHGTAYGTDGGAYRLDVTLRLRISSDFELSVYRESLRLTPLPG